MLTFGTAGTLILPNLVLILPMATIPCFPPPIPLPLCLARMLLLGHHLPYTPGLRAEMGAGFSRMNELTVTQASQGVCSYLLDAVKDAGLKGVVIGFDHRHHSRSFALHTAAVFLHRSVKVYLWEQQVFTPLVVGPSGE